MAFKTHRKLPEAHPNPVGDCDSTKGVPVSVSHLVQNVAGSLFSTVEAFWRCPERFKAELTPLSSLHNLAREMISCGFRRPTAFSSVRPLVQTKRPATHASPPDPPEVPVAG